ncbi:amidase family protein, partial [Streptomyces sp. NPDC059762]|uniref:amidase family protein n=1 Tax=Streptomyces sp. NPDC059762 TaxID=3346938 RepID=UPI00364CDB00
MTDHGAPPAYPPGLQDRPVAELARSLRSGALTSTDLVTACLDRITAVDPVVRAVLAVDDTALEQARAADLRHARGTPLGPLDGVPVLLKDNIDTAGLASTAAGARPARAPPPAAAPGPSPRGAPGAGAAPRSR